MQPSRRFCRASQSCLFCRAMDAWLLAVRWEVRSQIWMQSEHQKLHPRKDFKTQNALENPRECWNVLRTVTTTEALAARLQRSSSQRFLSAVFQAWLCILLLSTSEIFWVFLSVVMICDEVLDGERCRSLVWNLCFINLEMFGANHELRMVGLGGAVAWRPQGKFMQNSEAAKGILLLTFRDLNVPSSAGICAAAAFWTFPSEARNTCVWKNVLDWSLAALFRACLALAQDWRVELRLCAWMFGPYCTDPFRIF